MSKPRRPRRSVTGILLLDKPLGISSNAALQSVKHLYQADKAGHTGSLDPLATGVLPICFGEATKLSAVLLESDKSYCAEVKLGERTTTGDAEGEVIESAPLPDPDALRVAMTRFTGVIQQIPPMYSAIKRDGQRLYTLARQGIEVSRDPRTVVIHSLQIVRHVGDRLTLLVKCSKGTYIRTLVEDLLRAAGSCAHLAGLRRTAVSPFEVNEPVSMARLESLAADGGLAVLDSLLLSPAQGLQHWPQLRVDTVQAGCLARGQAVRATSSVHAGRLAVLDETGNLLGIGESTAEGLLVPRRWLSLGAPAGRPQ